MNHRMTIRAHNYQLNQGRSRGSVPGAHRLKVMHLRVASAKASVDLKEVEAAARNFANEVTTILF